MNSRQKAYKKGIMAEYLAAMYLWLSGYRILKRRYKTPVGEIDVLVEKRKMIVAVEVKSRKHIHEGLEAVNSKTQQRIERAVLHFLSHNPAYNEHDIRFDVFVFAWPFHIRHLDNAWRARS